MDSRNTENLAYIQTLVGHLLKGEGLRESGGTRAAAMQGAEQHGSWGDLFNHVSSSIRIETGYETISWLQTSNKY